VRQWRGLRVRLKVPQACAWGEIPAGTVLTVRHGMSGLTLEGQVCPCCGMRPLITRVDPREVEVVTEPAPPEAARVKRPEPEPAAQDCQPAEVA